MICLPDPVDNRFLFLDMNAFFASCEQHRQPELRGRPVGVTPIVNDAGCILAASYEAKRRGVTTGCRVGEARLKIPELAVVEAEPKYYMEIHNRIVSFLTREISPYPIRLSIDEFAIPLDKRERWTPNAHALAVKLKKRMSQIFSPYLLCSIGIGPNQLLAKLATDLQKPDGLVTIQTHTIRQALAQTCLRDLPGINWGIERQLNRIGVRTPVDLYDASEHLLRRTLGTSGTAWWHALRGYSIGSTLPGSAFGFGTSLSKTKSVSHSHVLAPTMRTKTKARAVLYKLWIKVVDRLRDKGLGAKQIVMAARGHMDRWSFSVTVQATQDVFRVWEAVTSDYDRLPDTFQPTQMYVVVFDLAAHSAWQPKLFKDNEPKVAGAFAAVEKMNSRYGRWTVKPASLLIAGDAAPNRISFHAPDYAMD